jgi:hypothetical protein
MRADFFESASLYIKFNLYDIVYEFFVNLKKLNWR